MFDFVGRAKKRIQGWTEISQQPPSLWLEEDDEEEVAAAANGDYYIAHYCPSLGEQNEGKDGWQSGSQATPLRFQRRGREKKSDQVLERDKGNKFLSMSIRH